ncbi:MAG: VOC family protein [Methylophilaceae bacterium]|uniref:VOC family protein n=1 Tax=Methylibium sp. TaxID=2067992 RepID=UPI003599AB8D
MSPTTHILSDPPMRLHHLAVVVRDQERNRRFLEDVLGFELVATWAERVKMEDVGEQSFCHTFYELEDGSALAFFQFENEEVYRRCQAKVGPEVTRFNHVAIRVGAQRLAGLKQRLIETGSPWREVDHGYCLSLYTRSPDGLELEFTVDHPDAEQMKKKRKSTAHDDLARWLAGDHQPNNFDQKILHPMT